MRIQPTPKPTPKPTGQQQVLDSKLNQLLLILTALLLVWSVVNPHDYLTWLLEVFPALIGFFLLWFFRKSFTPTPLLFCLICVHSWVLILGAHYTYAEVPLGKWFAEVFDLKRNHYDRLGHFMQGFEPAILARELLIKKDVLKKPGWLGFLCVTICLSFSALYELFEWGVAIILNQSAEAFLGTQGDIWDTQSDMFLALIGAVSAVVLIKAMHDKMLKRQRENIRA